MRYPVLLMSAAQRPLRASWHSIGAVGIRGTRMTRGLGRPRAVLSRLRAVLSRKCAVLSRKSAVLSRKRAVLSRLVSSTSAPLARTQILGRGTALIWMAPTQILGRGTVLLRSMRRGRSRRDPWSCVRCCSSVDRNLDHNLAGFTTPRRVTWSGRWPRHRTPRRRRLRRPARRHGTPHSRPRT